MAPPFDTKNGLFGLPGIGTRKASARAISHVVALSADYWGYDSKETLRHLNVTCWTSSQIEIVIHIPGKNPHLPTWYTGIAAIVLKYYNVKGILDLPKFLGDFPTVCVWLRVKSWFQASWKATKMVKPYAAKFWTPRDIICIALYKYPTQTISVTSNDSFLPLRQWIHTTTGQTGHLAFRAPSIF